MTFKQIAHAYFDELKKEVAVGESSGEATAELSYRTSLDNFFKNISRQINPSIATIPEPRNQNRLGRPDWRFHDTESMGIYGYAEAKGLDQVNSINIGQYRPQVERYLILGNPVLLSDGIDFVLFHPDGRTFSSELVTKPINWEKPEFNIELEVLFKQFFRQPGYREVSDAQLINEVAKRARLLSSEVQDLLQLDEDEAENDTELRTLKLLRSLQQTSGSSHDHSLKDNTVFSGFISQILTFGLLYAHRVVEEKSISPADKYEKIHDFWFSVMDEPYANRLIPFKTLVHALSEELSSELSRLGLWYDDLRRMLAYVRLSRRQVEIPDFHELYETFLSVYDPVARFDYGAFYTPRALAFYTVSLVKKIITERLDYQPGDTTLKVIDPCCGTGTFIEAMLDRFELPGSSQIIGFEILPAPYALAHYRMSMLGAAHQEQIRIILTNTLSDSIYKSEGGKAYSHAGLLLEQEQHLARELASPPLTIIIGNPPSSDSHFSEANEGSIIHAMLDDFRPEASARSSRQNTQKQLSNEFVKFLRWTMDKAEKSRPSIFALILPSSFSGHPSYKYARKYLAENCSEIRVLEFDKDKRRGVGGLNLFNTLQGRMLLVATLNAESKLPLLLKYHSISELSPKEKQDYLRREPVLEDWKTLSLDADFSFRESGHYDAALYSRFWPLSTKEGKGIFDRHCSSLKLAPTHLLVHASKGQLKRRSKFISKTENDYKAIKEKWYSGQAKPPPEKKITPEVKTLLSQAVSKDHITKYCYRPFVSTYVLLDDQLLSSLSAQQGSGTRDRPEIRAAFQDERVFGFAVSPAPEDIGEELHKFSSFCWNIPDNDLSARGNAHVFCNYFPEYKKGKNWDNSLLSNLNADLLSALDKQLDLPVQELGNLLTFYSYAMLSSNAFLQAFKGKLFSVSGAWPSIPITADKAFFLDLSALGRQLAEIESDDFGLTPSQEEEQPGFEYHKYRMGDGIIRLQDAEGNTLYSIDQIAVGILDFEVSGYGVVREWLKMHSFPYYRKAVGGEELRKLAGLIEKLSLYFDTGAQTDMLVAAILRSPLIEFSRSKVKSNP
jgi:hypothetical protein